MTMQTSPVAVWITDTIPQRRADSVRGSYSDVVVAYSEGEEIPAWYFNNPDDPHNSPQWEDPATGEKITGVVQWRFMTPLEMKLYEDVMVYTALGKERVAYRAGVGYLNTMMNYKDRGAGMIEAAQRETLYQHIKWGRPDVHGHEVAGWLVIARSEIDEAIKGWVGHSNDINALAEMVQAVATCMSAARQHGFYERDYQTAIDAVISVRLQPAYDVSKIVRMIEEIDTFNRYMKETFPVMVYRLPDTLIARFFHVWRENGLDVGILQRSEIIGSLYRPDQWEEMIQQINTPTTTTEDLLDGD